MTELMPDEVAVDYTCKFCGAAGTAAMNTSFPEDQFNQIYPLLCCDRCADYRTKLRWLKDGIIANAVKLIRGRMFGARSQKAKDELQINIEPKCREAFNLLTRRLAILHCAFVGTPTKWEPDFTAMLMQKPDKAEQAINFYLGSVK